MLLDAVTVGTNILLDHQKMRDRPPSIFHPKGWRPWSAAAQFVVHVVFIAVSMAIGRSNGFESGFVSIFALWTLRPRIGVALLSAYAVAGGRPTDADLTGEDQHDLLEYEQRTPRGGPHIPLEKLVRLDVCFPAAFSKLLSTLRQRQEKKFPCSTPAMKP